jgi:outer membrane receptor protein involved in Fe transport
MLCLAGMLASAPCRGGGADTVAQPHDDVSIITAAEIARERPYDLMEMLRSRVGLNENNSVITMRGVRGIAVFVDGFSSSVAELKALRPEQVEKVEIMRGAASARFGAEAMGGAIAVTTRQSERRPRGSLVQGVDSRHGHYTRLNGERDMDGLGWSLLVEDRVKNGFRTVPDSPFPYQITVSDEHSESTLLDGKLGWRGSWGEASLNLKRSDLSTFFGRPAWAFYWRTDNARAQLAWHVADPLMLEASFGEECFTADGVRDRGTGIDSVGLEPESRLAQAYRQREGSTALVWQGNDWSSRVGVNLVELSETFDNADYVSRQTTVSVDSVIHKAALFAAAELPVGAGRLEVGLRRDWQAYKSFYIYAADSEPQESRGGGVVKSATSPKVALSWPLGRGYRLRSSIGKGFSPPPASQLYNRYAGAGSVTLANPNLKPEHSTTVDIGLSHRETTGNWGVTLFATQWEDKVATRILDYGTPVVQQPQNVGVVTAVGVEAHWAGRLADGWSIDTNYTYTLTRIARDLANPGLVGNELPDMPRHKANLALSWEPDEHFSARAKLRAVGSAYTDEANTIIDELGYRWQKPAYAVLDLTALWHGSKWEFMLALDNVLDKDYVTGFFWHGSPRILRGELTLRY